jgi:carbamoyltransferase
MRILSFNVAHDSTVCSLNDGIVEFFCKEERLSRIKHDRHPFKALELYKSLNFGKIDHVLYCVPSNNEPDIELVYSNYVKKLFNKELENFSSLLHHASHAALAYYNSGFNEALVVVIDRNGSIFFMNGVERARESESVYIYNNISGIKSIYKSFWLYEDSHHYRTHVKHEIQNIFKNCDINVTNHNGIVKVYEAATTLIGQPRLESGKTMGLASYGNIVEEPLFVNDVALDHLFTNINGHVNFAGLESKSVLGDFSEDNYQFFADKARQVQDQTQRVVLNLIKKYVNITGIKNVCIVGGYGLNIVANAYYIKNLPEVQFYFEPVADDSGVPLGAAMLKHSSVSINPIEKLSHNFYHYYKPSSKQYGEYADISTVCNMLAEQKSIGIFCSNPEAGPRALGHRSILFDARNKNAKNIINSIKKREWYRPFAGVILEHYFQDYFDTIGIDSSPYMTINFDVKNDIKEYIPGIIHVDNTCRVQTVNSGFLYELLQEFYKLTNCPVLLNTSLNLAGQPLAQTKEDAIELLNNSTLDAVYFVDDKKLLLK